MSKTITTAALALSVGIAALGGGIATGTPAEASSKKIVVVKKNHHPHLFRYWGHYTTAAFVGGGCGYEYSRWQHTGSFYWKRRYYECRGWW